MATHKHYNVGPHATLADALPHKPEGSYWQTFAITQGGVTQYFWGRDYAGAMLYWGRCNGVVIKAAKAASTKKAETALESLTPQQRAEVLAKWATQ